MRTFEGNQI